MTKRNSVEETSARRRCGLTQKLCAILHPLTAARPRSKDATIGTQLPALGLLEQFPKLAQTLSSTHCSSHSSNARLKICFYMVHHTISVTTSSSGSDAHALQDLSSGWWWDYWNDKVHNLSPLHHSLPKCKPDLKFEDVAWKMIREAVIWSSECKEYRRQW